MKKILIVSVVVILAVLILGVAGFAYAQTQTPPTPGYPYGAGMMRRGGGFGMGMMGRWGQDGFGPMHEYMVDAFAEALGMTPEDLQAQIDAGKTPWQVAQSQGLTDEQIRDLMLKAHDKALDAAVAAGVITQEQADWMDSHMEQMWQGEFGPGNCPMHAGALGPGRGPALQRNNP